MHGVQQETHVEGTLHPHHVLSLSYAHAQHVATDTLNSYCGFFIVNIRANLHIVIELIEKIETVPE